ncbi:MAG: ABC transporter ATP-binding protein [Deltaproteobacteria bacterium]|nr:ABC transporter ATP-binding protein [Deltaproteobacteria bacterium]
MIQVVDLHKKFGDHAVLRGINLKVIKGTTRVIVGLSGSGKTVLMKHIIGLMRPDHGQVFVEGEDITKLGKSDLIRIRRKFGMVFQQAALFDSMTVFENVAFPLREHTKFDENEIKERVHRALAVVDLYNIDNKFPAELSGGMRKRVGLARAIIIEPSCVLYDEPTTGLDPVTTDSVDQMIIDANKRLQVTSVVISHDIGSALAVADQIAVIHQGEIVADTTPDGLRQSTHPFVQEFLHCWFKKQ